MYVTFRSRDGFVFVRCGPGSFAVGALRTNEIGMVEYPVEGTVDGLCFAGSLLTSARGGYTGW